MDPDILHVLIQQKLDDGRLPHNSIPRVWGGPGRGETCQACDEVVNARQVIMEGISSDGKHTGVQFHVKCFYLWDTLRQFDGHEKSGPA